MELRRLGRTSIGITPLGLGCWQFSAGRGAAGRFWPTLPEETTKEIVHVSLEGGINWFDTAELYGWGASERALARALASAGRKDGDVVVATKWWPVLRGAGSIRRTIDRRLECLEGFAIDLHQIHIPWASLSSNRRKMAVMAELVEAGKIRAVGVSNYGARSLRRCHALLARHGIPLASNQVPYSLLDRRIEHNGLLETARELGITIIAYSPLAQGLLTGKFHERPERVRDLRGARRSLPLFRRRGLQNSAPVVDELRRIAIDRDVTPGQVALRWLVQFHGDVVVAIPGATKVHHAEQNAGALHFELGPQELERLDRVSRGFGMRVFH
jgi:aryl-alcohol dehydrogenase-like predicted oxidoreductase